MKIKLLLKRVAEHIPYSVGKWTAFTPFRVRLGADYTKFCGLIQHYENAPAEEKYRYTIEQLNNIVKYAQANIPFYRNLYGKSLIEIKSLKDFEALPVVTKSQIREYSKECSGAMLLNTGGSTDGPLSFYVDKNVWAREWAHMHYIWGLRGYKKTDLIITMLGKPIGKRPFKYNAVHNEFLLNPYVNAEKNIEDLLILLKKYPIKYFQGYPSTIYNFFKEIETSVGTEEMNAISRKLKSCFFSSEYPMPYMIDYLKDAWGIRDYISWYGHSEMCILAYDKVSNGEYMPFITYGYAEEANGVLLGTSFHNYDMPLIRYSTEDLVESDKDRCGLVEKFRITRGRSGDFIEDVNGRKYALTFFLGRHHKIYNIADFVQMYQPKKGKATYYITFKRHIPIDKTFFSDYFDFPDMGITFDYVPLREPIRTKRGKLKLKLSKDDIPLSRLSVRG